MKKKLTEDKIVDIVVYFLLAIIGIITVYPFYYTIICSLNDGMDLMKGGVYLFLNNLGANEPLVRCA